MIRTLCLIFPLLLWFAELTAQTADSSTVLSFDDYVVIVKVHHPVAFQARLLEDRASGSMRIARGGFDPKVDGSWSQKSFDGKNYYQIGEGSFKVPMWYGLEVKAGYEANNGQFLDDSDFVPDAGLWSLGISAPLGRGLVLDVGLSLLQL